MRSIYIDMRQWIQNVIDLRQNYLIGKVFELAEPHFFRNMEHDFCIKMIFPYRDRNCNHNRNRILNPCMSHICGFIGQECFDALVS